MNKSALVLSFTLTSAVCALAEETPSTAQTATSSPGTEEVFVLGSRKGDFTIITESTQKLVETAGTLGDPMAAAFSLPGVVASGGDGGEPAVRGSSPDDNVYIVDFMPTSYIFHEFGVSIFSEFIMQDFQLYSAGFGPEYTGVTGAAFDITLRQPKQQPISAIADLSMLRSGLFVEGAVTDSSAFYLSARQSLIDKFVNNEDASDEDEGIRFQQIPKDFDYQFKYTWELNDNHRLNISANGAGDEAAAELTDQADLVQSNPDFEGDARIENRFDGQNIVWQYFGDNHHTFTLGAGLVKDEANLYWGGDRNSNEITLEQTNFKGRYKMPLGKQHLLTMGFQHSDYVYNYRLNQVLFICTEFDPDCELNRRGRVDIDTDFELKETTAFINNSWAPTGWLTLDTGLQWQKNNYNDDQFIHPRLAATFTLNPKWSITTKAGRYNRFPDLGTALPDIGNPDIESPTADHYTLGVMNDIGNGWSWTLEGYYKTLDDLPLSLSQDEDDPINPRRYASDTEGEAKGVDLLINKDKTGKWYSWLAISLSKSERTNQRTGETKDYRLDTPVIFNWVFNYQFTEKFNMGWRWTIRSGSAYTPIIGVRENPFFEDAILPRYGEPFSDNLPVYNRLDIRFKWDLISFGKDSAIILDIINATNHENVTERTLDYSKVKTVNDEVRTEDEVGIGIQPALTYRIWF